MTNERPIAFSDENLSVASFGHEINNSLDSLINLLFLIEGEASLTRKVRQYLKLAQEEALRISQISHTTMNLSRHPGEARINVPQLLNSTLELYKSRLHAKGISIDVRYCR